MVAAIFLTLPVMIPKSNMRTSGELQGSAGISYKMLMDVAELLMTLK